MALLCAADTPASLGIDRNPPPLLLPSSRRPPQYLGMQANPSRIWRPIWGLYCFNMPCERGLACALGVLTDIRFRNTKYTSFFDFRSVPFLRTGLLFVTQGSFDLFEKVSGGTERRVPRQEKKSLQLHTWVQEKNTDTEVKVQYSTILSALSGFGRNLIRFLDIRIFHISQNEQWTRKHSGSETELQLTFYPIFCVPWVKQKVLYIKNASLPHFISLFLVYTKRFITSDQIRIMQSDS